jgi:hypothetical protein
MYECRQLALGDHGREDVERAFDHAEVLVDDALCVHMQNVMPRMFDSAYGMITHYLCGSCGREIVLLSLGEPGRMHCAFLITGSRNEE